MHKRIKPSTNVNASIASQTRKLHMKLFGRIKESKWRTYCKSMGIKQTWHTDHYSALARYDFTYFFLKVQIIQQLATEV